MRIVLASEKQIPSRGGAESWTYELGKWLLSKNYDVHFVTTRVAPDLDLPSHRVHQIDRSGGCLRTADRLADWLAEQQFDIVHDMGLGYTFDVLQPHFGSQIAIDQACYRAYSSWRAYWRRTKSVLFAGDRRTLNHRQYTQSRGFYLAVSPMVAADLHSLQKVDSDRIVTVCNGVNTDKYHPQLRHDLRAAARSELGLGSEDLALVVIAHNYTLKGVPLLLDTLRKAHDFASPLKLIVVGGPRQHSWRQLGQHHVMFTGSLKNVLPVLAASDVYVHPTRYDACSLSLLEAMACGLPVITTPVNGASCFIDHGKNGLILDSPEPSQLIGLLDTLVSEDARGRLSTAARQTVEGWNQSDNFQAIESLYHRVVAERQLARAASTRPEKAA